MDVLRLYRDDGPVVLAVAGLLPRLPLPSVAAAAAGLGALVAGLALDGATTGWLTATGWLLHLVLAAAALRHPVDGRLGWLEPVPVRAAEYTFVVWLAWRAGGAALPVAFVLLVVVAFHHYDLFHRTWYQQPPSPSVNAAGLGWDGRTGVLLVASVLGMLPLAATALAALGVVVFVGESLRSWRDHVQDPPGASGP